MASRQSFLVSLRKNWAFWAVVVLVAFITGLAGWYVADKYFDQNQVVTESVFVNSDSGGVADVVDSASKSVVSINVDSTREVQSFFFGSQEYQTESAGTGFIVSSDGIVVTNKHVIGDNPTGITIIDSDGNEYEDVQIIDTDPLNDVAFLRINGADGLEVAKLGDSADMRVGDEVIAIGNALGQFSNTVTRGIISGIGRPLANVSGGEGGALLNLFQTDAAINQGNSGGPLINTKAEVIGINTAVAGGAENIGFAIPINDIKAGLQSIQDNGELVRPYIGIRFVMLDQSIVESLELDIEEGALVDAQPGQKVILNDSPADKAGLQQGDIITKVDGVDVDGSNQLSGILNLYNVGDTVTLTVYRDDEFIELDLTFEAAPDDLFNN